MGSFVVLGAGGYVGREFCHYWQAAGHRVVALTRAALDYSNVETLTAFLQRERPAFLLNAAGFTGRPNVDACELHKTECLAGNAVLPGRVRAACEAAGVPWGHISSGCIYTGARADGRGFSETDAPNFTFRQNNCSFYSGTKALGEEVLHGAEQCFIWRLRIPFNHIESGRNYLTKLMRYPKLLEATNSLSHLNEFVAACAACVERRLPYGIYNVTNPGQVTTRGVVALIQKSGVCRKEFEFFENEQDFMQQAAKTPRSNCVLDSTKLAQHGVVMTEVHEAIERALNQWQKEAA